jgi:hypothetical protein
MPDPRDEVVERNVERLVRAAALPPPESRVRESFQTFLERSAAPPPRNWQRFLPAVAAAMLLALLIVIVRGPFRPSGPEGSPAQASASAEEIRRWISELGSSDYATREKATERLRALGPSALLSLQSALRETNDAEVRARLFALLRPLEIAAARELACGAVDGRILLQTADGATRLAFGGPRQAPTFRFWWSPDGRWLAYAAGNTLHVLEILTERDELLTESVSASVVWSPDSAWLAYRGAMEGAVLRKVGDWGTRDLKHYGTPCGWSRDGETLFLNNIGPGLVRLDLKSGRQAPVAESTGFAYASDGEKVYYLGKADGERPFRMPTCPLMSLDLRSGKQRTILGFIPQASLGMLALTSDGKTIAFTKSSPTTVAEREAGGGLQRTLLCTVQVDGSAEKVIGAIDGVAAPSWSPDGRRIAFERERKTVVYWVDSGREQVLEGLAPAWCPVPPAR